MDAPNVFLLTVDSLRADHTGWGGYDRQTTPFLDGLAERAISFDRAYATGPRTSESFQSILAGTYPLRFGESPKLSEGHTTIAEVFSDSGYRTVGIHSNPYLSTSYGYDRGFDQFVSSDHSVDDAARLVRRLRRYIDPESGIYSRLRTIYRWFEHRNRSVPYARAEPIADRTTEWLGKLGREDRPFFLWAHFMDPHYPYVAPGDHRSAFRQTVCGSRRVSKLFSKMLSDPASVTEDEVDLLVDLYDGEIRYVDAQLRRIWDALQRESLHEDTLLVITADHGEEFGEHGDFSHASTPEARRRVKLQDELLHVPLLIYDPTGTIGDRSEGDVTSLIDLPPTLATAGDATVPDSWHGVPIGNRKKTRAFSGHWIRIEDKAYPAASLRAPDSRLVYDGRSERYEVRHGDADPELHASLESFVTDVPGSGSAGPVADVDAAAQERLEDLGYLD